jgi:hypothetical protein
MRGHRTFRALVPVSVSVLGAIAWLGGAVVAAKLVPSALWYYPNTAAVLVGAIALLGAAGGIVTFSFIFESIEFFVRGYRIKWSDRTRCSYDERTADGSIVSLPIVYKPLAEGYRPPCEVRIPSEVRWNEETPSWARGRRAEIIEHIRKSLGAEFGRRVQVVDLPATD